MKVSGQVNHPKDLKPAIEALTEKGLNFLKDKTKGREITPKDIAKAADFENGYLNG